ncbi:SSS family solute:Na+ symporter [Anseongella ginsenosidimutans]|uniref:SSS family solute:Na+ symporter n=1 Tax=Anseongella ginsenosidimutans TaxID=496056 RepID=A0A4R3KRM8_9SPHI|nr:sodium:solute symporter [Anseongella ginsenosidimutans]QEC53057.1 sodium/solute symporter [Anseongella ginsenosidimutans]TCS87672.1 SSS family solute:Na+ symporter [Anseongella ginsenosidimutans]
MISNLDVFISGIYILGIVAVGLWASMRKAGSGGSVSGTYFLAGKTLRWPTIGLALFATNISCVHLVSLAQSGFDSGLLNGNFEWMASFTLILLALFFVPFYIKSGVATLPDFLERRYNRASRDWLTIISIFSAVIIHIAFSLLAGGIVLETLFNVNMYVSIIGITVLVGIYTILGGLSAVVITESIQTIVLVLGAVIITAACWNQMGGWSAMTAVLESNNEMSRLSMLRPAGDDSGMPWYSIFLGYPILGIWYWCADQTIVQRVLGAKDENHARAGALFCGFIKILPVFIFVLPGLFAYALAQKGVLNLESITSIDSSGAAVVNSKGIYTLMIVQLLPAGLIGIVVAALLSGIMSQVSGALNSISTLVSYDIFKRVYPETSDKKLVKVGRVSAAICLVISILLLPLLNSYESLFIGLNDVIAHIAPPITCVFLLGIFWGGASPKSAQYTLWIGSLLGIAVYIASKVYPESLIGQIPFMMTAFYLFCICVLLQVSISLIAPFEHTAESKALFWKNPFQPLTRPGWTGMGNYKVLSGLLLLIMVVLYSFF